MASGKAARVDAAIAASNRHSGSVFVKDISAWVEKAKGRTDLVIKKIAFDLAGRVVTRTPVDTGRAKGNWNYGEDAADTNTTETTDPTGSNTIALLLRGVSRFDALKRRSIFITNSLPYIKRLENGWSDQAPNGMVRLTVAEFMGITQDAVRFVRNGGTDLK